MNWYKKTQVLEDIDIVDGVKEEYLDIGHNYDKSNFMDSLKKTHSFRGG